ncbi:unnamed protein product (macronuclear) [Paramecium tetraurelia]|uniref:Endonuclease/exonuclease/phosphatase domain-containing protein n=1 Tax=Paramecium tetraurelia TaxID=5888 RepID=A0E883_PARTE|nr:uncharacterized protein GSPATT00024228001 [Paramecium tetraurelia]CAK91500.1 unnamed protein product [Paramecium tetraurelia]|eukprot:XP_001458897.1 hypothetical protein (macronuclear) [Paramecium tetraurelia strain d4-2]
MKQQKYQRRTPNNFKKILKKNPAQKMSQGMKAKSGVKNVVLDPMPQGLHTMPISAPNIKEKHLQITDITRTSSSIENEAQSLKNPIEKNQDTKLKILCWNISSIKKNTFQEIQQQKPHLICLQEVRNKALKDSIKYKYLFDQKRSHHSGRIIIGIHKQFQSRIQPNITLTQR